MIATRFAVAVHILLLVAERSQEQKATSETIARSIKTNPVVVRRITGRLTRAGLLRVRRGPGGAVLARPAAEITLEDVWQAMKEDQEQPLLPLHAAVQDCALGREIGQAFAIAERAMEQALGATRLDGLTAAPALAAAD